jgi:hypothetical protein
MLLSLQTERGRVRSQLTRQQKNMELLSLFLFRDNFIYTVDLPYYFRYFIPFLKLRLKWGIKLFLKWAP